MTSRDLDHMAARRVLTATLMDLPGHKVTASRGIVRGLVVRSPHVGHQIMGGIKALFGGNITQFEVVSAVGANTARTTSRLNATRFYCVQLPTVVLWVWWRACTLPRRGSSAPLCVATQLDMAAAHRCARRRESRRTTAWWSTRPRWAPTRLSAFATRRARWPSRARRCCATARL